MKVKHTDVDTENFTCLGPGKVVLNQAKKNIILYLNLGGKKLYGLYLFVHFYLLLVNV